MKGLSAQSTMLDETAAEGILSVVVPRVVDLILPGRREPPSEHPASGDLSGGRAAAVVAKPRPPKVGRAAARSFSRRSRRPPVELPLACQRPNVPRWVSPGTVMCLGCPGHALGAPARARRPTGGAAQHCACSLSALRGCSCPSARAGADARSDARGRPAPCSALAPAYLNPPISGRWPPWTAHRSGFDSAIGGAVSYTHLTLPTICRV
eukprot:4252277-Alexandrium_andersonii.AAC.1